jgi:phytoene dehydrogenase-like protein
MTVEHIHNEILKASDKPGDLKLRQLFKGFAKLDQEMIVLAVIQVIENTGRPETLFRDQEFAGRVLQEIKPNSTMDLETVLLRTLRNWDKSIEEFPFWIRDNYGLDTVKKVFETIRLSHEEQDKLNTMKWWLQID